MASDTESQNGNSDSESGPGLAERLAASFDQPGNNATLADLREALRKSQLEAAQLMIEKKALQCQLATHTARKNGRKKDQGPLSGPDMLGYHAVIISLSKSFGVLHEPWIGLSTFCATKTPPETTAKAIFDDPVLYSKQLLAQIYLHVPQKFHELIDSSKFSHLGRTSSNSSMLDVRPPLAGIKAPDDLRDLLYFPGDDRTKKCKGLPPILYPALKKDSTKLFKNRILPLALRCVLYGPTSLDDNATKKPSSSMVGCLWKVLKLTEGSMAFTCIALIFVLSGREEKFEENSKLSGIPFQKYFRQYKKLLAVTHEERPAVGRQILKFWNSIVFASVSSVIQDVVIPDEGEDAEFAEAFEGLDINDSDEDNPVNGGEDDGGLDADAVANHHPPAASVGPHPSWDVVSDMESDPPVRPAARRRRRASTPPEDDGAIGTEAEYDPPTLPAPPAARRAAGHAPSLVPQTVVAEAANVGAAKKGKRGGKRK
ncbi:hypothetical protein C8J57DRAFT_1721190 [Mycena rebaudengoi]|nr:hypothetical protein C8J57DRAFT_1721190 [Mycena rebaudengoi]